MSHLLQNFRSLQRALPPQGIAEGTKLPEDAVSQMIAILSDGDFVKLSPDQQFSFLDFVQTAYTRTYHPSAPRLAAALQRVFQAHLRSGNQVPLSRLLKTYDFLYFLYWSAAVSIEQQRGFDTGVVIPFSRYLDRAASSRDYKNPANSGPERPRGSGWAIRLCYLAEFAYDGKGNALAPVMQNLLESLAKYYPGEYELYLYAWKYKDPEVLERVRTLGVSVRSFDLSEYSETELLRLRQSFAADHIDVAITDMNSAVPHYLFENGVAPAQIFYQLGMPFWRLRKLAAVFQGWQIAPETLGFRPEQCHFLPAPESPADLNPPVDPARVQAERHRSPRAKHIVGFYGRLVKITPEHCNIVLRILDRHPGTIVALGGTGNAEPILQFVREHGLEDRMFVINEFVDGHVWGHVLDVFLDTFPLMGGYSCREVMAKGKPVIYMPSGEMPNLQTLRDPDLQAVTPEQYTAHVSRLLSDPDSYRRACSRARELSAPTDARIFAETLHSALGKVRTRSLSGSTEQFINMKDDVGKRVQNNRFAPAESH